MEAIASKTAESVATSTLGSVVSGAAEKGVDKAKDDEAPQSVKIGIKVSEVLLSSILTSLAITLFGRLSSKVKGHLAFVGLTLAVSVVCALLTAYIKIYM